MAAELRWLEGEERVAEATAAVVEWRVSECRRAGDLELDLTVRFTGGEGTFTLRVENAVFKGNVDFGFHYFFFFALGLDLADFFGVLAFTSMT